MKDRERDQEANVVDTAVQVLGAAAARLDWPRYQQLLGTFSRAMQRTEGKVSQHWLRRCSPTHLCGLYGCLCAILSCHPAAHLQMRV